MKRLLIIATLIVMYCFSSHSAYAQSLEKAQTHLKAGEKAFLQSDFKSALTEFTEALEIFKYLKNEQGISYSHILAGEACRNLGRNDEAMNHYKEALPIAERNNFRDGIGYCKNGIGMVHFNQGQFEEAVPYLEDAYSIFVELNDQSSMWTTAGNLVDAYYQLGQYEKTLPHLEGALAAVRKIGEKKIEATLLSYLGEIYYYLDRFIDALSVYEQALVINQKLNSKKGVGENINDMGIIYWELGRYDEALKRLEESRIIFEKLGLKDEQATTISNIGLVWVELGQYEKALSYLERGLAIHIKTKNKIMVGNTLNNIGEVNRYLNRSEKALSYYKEALKVFSELKNNMGMATSLGNAGLIYMDLGQYDKALSNFNEALILNRKIGSKSGIALTLNNMGLIYRDSGKIEKSIPYFKETVGIFKETGYKKGECIALRNLGTAYFSLKRYKESFTYCKESLVIAKDIGHIDGIYLSAWGLGRAYLGLGKFEDAVKSYKESIDAMESIRGKLSNEESRTLFVKDKLEVYEELIKLLIEMKRFEEAFNYMERARSRAFLDMIGAKNFTVGNEYEVNLLKREEEVRLKLQNLNSKVYEGTLKEKEVGVKPRTRSISEELNPEIKKKKEEYTGLIKEIKTVNPELASLITVSPLTLSDVQKLLPEGIEIIEYFTTENKLLISSLSNDEIEVFDIDISRDELNKKIIELRDSITDSLISKDLTDFQTKSKSLYKLLIEPTRGSDNRVEDKVIVIPHGPLHYLPFSCLYDGENYIIDEHTLIIDPSSSILKFIVKKRKNVKGKILALGNPKTDYSPLPYAEKEVSTIEEIMEDVVIHLGRSATETLGRERVSNYSVIHMACHGKFVEKDPMSSALYLAKDGKNDGTLMADEVYSLDLKDCSLVVLSACETGLSKVTKGDELIGLSRGFIFAGTPSLVVSLWEVSDDSTSDLMVEFYKNLKGGMEKPEALRKAQIYLKSREEYSSPFYWAPFFIIGDWE